MSTLVLRASGECFSPPRLIIILLRQHLKEQAMDREGINITSLVCLSHLKKALERLWVGA